MAYFCQTAEGKPSFQIVAEDARDQRDYMNNDNFLQQWISTDGSTIRRDSTVKGACDTKTAYYQAAFYSFAAARLAAGNGMMPEAEQFYAIGIEAELAGDETPGYEEGFFGNSGSNDPATISAIQAEYYDKLRSVCSTSTNRNCLTIISFPLTALNTTASIAMIEERQEEIAATKPEIKFDPIQAAGQVGCAWRFLLSGFFLPTRPKMCGYKAWQIYLLRAGILTTAGFLIYSRVKLLADLADVAGGGDD